ncbi:helix-turn-helix domain-containing protein [Leptolyngbya sp. FACHB-261]|nr:helix-turn-helix domain-containing protein [Leptolyngbya sp. FACHB-261]
MKGVAHEFCGARVELDRTACLLNLMQQAEIPSLRDLSRRAGVSRRSLDLLRQGQITRLRVEQVLSLSQVLKLSVQEFLQQFSPDALPQDEAATQTAGVKSEPVKPELAKSEPIKPEPIKPDPAKPDTELSIELASLRSEYERLQAQLQSQQQDLEQQFRTQTLQALESLLLQWPTAAYAATKNPQAPAKNLLPILRPLEQLLSDWGIEPIGEVGSETAFDPQLHQLEGAAQPGDSVRVRYVGYRQGDTLLYRARVSPV